MGNPCGQDLQQFFFNRLQDEIDEINRQLRESYGYKRNYITSSESSSSSSLIPGTNTFKLGWK